MYQEKWENAYLALKNPRAFTFLRQALDPADVCSLCLDSAAVHCWQSCEHISGAPLTKFWIRCSYVDVYTECLYWAMYAIGSTTRRYLQSLFICCCALLTKLRTYFWSPLDQILDPLLLCRRIHRMSVLGNVCNRKHNKTIPSIPF